VLALGIRYLTGTAMATDVADRSRPEWPPHPDRVFMALVAAHKETDATETEHEALIWLEAQGPPSLAGAGVDAFATRDSVVSYVPVNDTSAPRLRRDQVPSDSQVQSGLELLPERRPRQARTFPVAVPASDRVHLIWPQAEPEPAVRSALGALCRKVTRVGHSASLVQMWVDEDPPAPTYVPTPGMAATRLRVPGPGRLEYLVRCHEMGQRPTAGTWSGYERADARREPTPSSDNVLDPDMILLRILPRDDRRSLGLTSTLALVRALRGTVLSRCPEPIPQWVSGHRDDGTPTTEPHLAFAPLAHVGRQHAHGHLLGAALVIPRAVSMDERQRCLGPLLYKEETGEPRQCLLRLGSAGEWQVCVEDRLDPPLAMRARTWIGGRRAAMRWATVTPIVFDRYPKADGDAEASIATACTRMGLPAPSDVIVSGSSLFEGVPPAGRFPAMQTKHHHGPARYHQHAVITFPRPVRGPILVGAGRYRGYGLCRPHGGFAEDETP
jgi:CRISPR-associated protein Csb2